MRQVNPLASQIWEQTCGTVTHFVAGASTGGLLLGFAASSTLFQGGTVSGTGKYLKEQSSSVRIVMPDPVGSIFKQFYDTGAHDKAQKYLIEGVGKDSIPGALDLKVVDEIIVVNDQQAFGMCHKLCQKEGVLAGIALHTSYRFRLTAIGAGGSAGMNLFAAIEVANRATEPCTVVTILPDSGVKYLSKVISPSVAKPSSDCECRYTTLPSSKRTILLWRTIMIRVVIEELNHQMQTAIKPNCVQPCRLFLF